MSFTPEEIARHRKDMWKIRLIGLGTLVVGLLIGVAPLGWDLYAETWPTVKGVVTNSHIDHDLDDDNYTLTIWYDYEVNGQTYSGSFSRTSSVRPSTVSEGSAIDVHYNPAFPAFSRMDASITIVGLLIGCCCAVPMGLAFLGISFLPPQKSVDLSKMRRFG